MHLTLLLPGKTLLSCDVTKIIAEAVDGAFCLLPRHADVVAPLAPGLLTFCDAEGVERLAAVDEGTLVKCGQAVWVSVRDAALSDSDDPVALRALVDAKFRQLDEQEKTARSVLARLEASIVRRFADLR